MVYKCSNNKRLSVEKMKNMPIDDIINLYQEGYRLEEIDQIEYADPKMEDIIPKMEDIIPKMEDIIPKMEDIIPKMEDITPKMEDIDSKIMTMTYGQQCSGNIDIAFNNTTQLLGTSGAVQKGTVWAQSSFSDFRCLDSVEFNVIKYADISFYIEIRRDDGTGKPKGIPLADDAGLIMRTPVIPYTELPTTWNWRTFTVGAILDATAGNYWICFVPVDFYDSPPYRELAYDRFGIQDGLDLPGYKSAVFKEGSWGTSSTFAFATYKKSTFAIPTLTTIDISPATATVGIGATQVFSATPKDQWGNPITGVTITWSVTDTNKGNIFPTTGSPVLFTATSSGSTTIKATSGTIVGSATVTITTPTPVCTYMSDVIPNPSTLVVNNPVTLTVTVSPAGIYTVEFFNADNPTQVFVSKTETTSTTTYSQTWTPNTAGTYHIKGRIGIQCSSTNPIAVTVNPTGQQCGSISDVIPNPATVIVNNPVTLTATVSPAGIYTVEFFNADNPTQVFVSKTETTSTTTYSQTWTPNTVGTYHIKARVGTQCTSINPVTATVNPSTGVTCASITTPTATPSTIGEGSTTILSTTVIPSSPTSQEFSVQFVEGITQIGGSVTTVNHIATKTWIPSTGTHNVGARVGTECISPGTVQVTVSVAQVAGAGGAMIIVAIAALGLAYFTMRKSSVPPTEKK